MVRETLLVRVVEKEEDMGPGWDSARSISNLSKEHSLATSNHVARSSATELL
jgi:hypothetical protein